MPESMIGTIAVCSKGKLGIVTARRELPWGLSWTGVALDGSGLWSSRDPELIASSALRYENLLRGEYDNRRKGGAEASRYL